MSVYEILALATNIAREKQGEMMVTGKPYTVPYFTLGNRGHDPEDRFNALAPDVMMTEPKDETTAPIPVSSVVPYDLSTGFGPTWICIAPAGVGTGIVSSLYMWADMAKPQVPGYPIPPQVAIQPTVGAVGQTCEVMLLGYYKWDGSKWNLDVVPPDVVAFPAPAAVGQTVHLTVDVPPFLAGYYVYNGTAWEAILDTDVLPSIGAWVYVVMHLTTTGTPLTAGKYVWDVGNPLSIPPRAAGWVPLYLVPVARLADLPSTWEVVGQRRFVVAEGMEYYWTGSTWDMVYDRYLFAIANMPELIKLDSEDRQWSVGVQF